tara:strand:+ start:10848 stop:12629 length:1782 start_codon:yes stop_codon:yes gene_type:complete
MNDEEINSLHITFCANVISKNYTAQVSVGQGYSTWDDEDVSYHVNNYINFLIRRKTTMRMVMFWLEWFSVDDILSYYLAPDVDGTWLISYNTSPLIHRLARMSSYEQNRVKSKAGRFLLKHLKNMHSDEGKGDSSIIFASMCKEFSSQWASCIREVSSDFNKYTVDVYHRSDDIATKYMSFDGTKLNSCMSYRESEYLTGDIHPTMCYGGTSGVSLAIVTNSETEEQVGRTLIYEGRYINIYPSNNEGLRDEIRLVLASKGIASGRGSLEGAHLNFIRSARDHEHAVCPYLDGDATHVAPLYLHDDCIQYTIHRREAKHPQKPMALLVTSSSESAINTQHDELHRVGAFDMDTLSVVREYDQYCYTCEDGIDSDSDFSFYTVDETLMCSEDCASNAGYNYAITENGDHEWTSDYCYEWDGDLWTEEAILETDDLNIIDDIVYNKADCAYITAESASDQEYLPKEGLLVVPDRESASTIYRDYMQCLELTLSGSTTYGTSSTDGLLKLHEKAVDSAVVMVSDDSVSDVSYSENGWDDSDGFAIYRRLFRSSMRPKHFIIANKAEPSLFYTVDPIALNILDISNMSMSNQQGEQQ